MKYSPFVINMSLCYIVCSVIGQSGYCLAFVSCFCFVFYICLHCNRERFQSFLIIKITMYFVSVFSEEVMAEACMKYSNAEPTVRWICLN